jgi:hypothetical protein
MRESLPAPGRPRSSALTLALGAVTSRSVRLLGSNGRVLGGGRVGDIGLWDCAGLGLGNIDSGGDGNHSGHRLGLDPGVCFDDG